MTPFSTPGCVSAGLRYTACPLLLFDDRAELVRGLSPGSKPGSCSDVAVLSGGHLHQGFVAGNAGKRRLPCIAGLVGDAGVLYPLSLLNFDLLNFGEVLSRNAFVLCIMYLKPAT